VNTARRYLCLVAACLTLLCAGARSQEASDFPSLPLPPAVEGLVAIPKPHAVGRIAHVRMLRRAAEERGLPPEVADAVAHVESAYNPNAVGNVGEVGLMQVRASTAVMLGHTGTIAELHEPATNVRYGVRYLVEAWKLANGNLCRALMKYRAGHGEERMSERSVEYCRRARAHLAAIGSPLASAPLPAVDYVPGSVLPAAGAARGLRTRVASLGRPGAAVARKAVSQQELARRAKSRQLWAAHEARMKVITAKFNPAQLRIAAGI
jgi:Transglycosylase SLT domain